MQRHDRMLQHRNIPSPLETSCASQEMAQPVEDPGGDRSLKIRLRSYQYEMLKKSLEGNVIVAMPTGSKDSRLGPDIDSNC